MFSTAVVFTWALAVIVPLSLLMVSHAVPLPAPSRPQSSVDLQSTTLATLDSARAGRKVGNGWKVVHILVAGCPCSSFTASSLATRKPSPECLETVIVVGGNSDWEQSLIQSGFEVQHKDSEQLAKDTGIEGGPWLLLISPESKIVYSGGYATQRPRPGIILEDLNILHAAFSGGTLPNYPAYGCASTPLLQGQLDPLGVCMTIK